MEDVWLSLVGAVIGGILASGSSAVIMLIQSRKEDRRHRREVATRLAIEDRSRHIELANNEARAARIYPLDLYIAYHLELLKMTDDGNLTAEKLARLNETQARLRADYDEVRNERPGIAAAD